MHGNNIKNERKEAKEGTQQGPKKKWARESMQKECVHEETHGFVHVALFAAVGAVAVDFDHGAAHVGGAHDAVLPHDLVLKHCAVDACAQSKARKRT